MRARTDWFHFPWRGRWPPSLFSLSLSIFFVFFFLRGESKRETCERTFKVLNTSLLPRIFHRVFPNTSIELVRDKSEFLFPQMQTLCFLVSTYHLSLLLKGQMIPGKPMHFITTRLYSPSSYSSKIILNLLINSRSWSQSRRKVTWYLVLETRSLDFINFQRSRIKSTMKKEMKKRVLISRFSRSILKTS